MLSNTTMSCSRARFRSVWMPTRNSISMFEVCYKHLSSACCFSPCSRLTAFRSRLIHLKGVLKNATTLINKVFWIAKHTWRLADFYGGWGRYKVKAWCVLIKWRLGQWFKIASRITDLWSLFQKAACEVDNPCSRLIFYS